MKLVSLNKLARAMVALYTKIEKVFATKTEVVDEIDRAFALVESTITTNSNSIQSIQSDLGVVSNLNTQNKTVVGAINEVKADKNADTIDNYHIWVGTQAEYDAIATKSNTTLYFIKSN